MGILRSKKGYFCVERGLKLAENSSNSDRRGAMKPLTVGHKMQ